MLAVLDYFRSSLTPKVVEALICSQDWMRISKTPVSVKESLEEIEKFEKGTLLHKNIMNYFVYLISLICFYLGDLLLLGILLILYFVIVRVSSSWHGHINGIIKCQLAAEISVKFMGHLFGL